MRDTIKKPIQFAHVQKYGRKIRSSSFIARILYENKYYADISKIVDNKNQKLLLGMKVSKKIGKAHVRNKVRRRIRHIARLVQQSKMLGILQNKIHCILIIPHKEFEHQNFEKLRQEFIGIYSKISQPPRPQQRRILRAV